MYRILCLIGLVGGIGISTSYADVPLEKGLKNIDPVLAFEGVEKYSDYVFFIRFKSFSGSPVGVKPTIVAIKNEKPFAMGAQRRLFDTQVLAVPKKIYDEKSKANRSLEWLEGKVEGVLVADFETPSTVGKTTDKEPPVNRYLVTVVDGKLVVKLADKKKTDQGPSRLVPLWVAGLIGSGSIIWLGLWLTRRNKTNPQPPINPCSPQ